ncbi:MAG: class I SAM-dependent RNA methyltransferase [Planctomycetota bacterium]
MTEESPASQLQPDPNVVRIESMAHGGAGLARAEGKIVFVSGALPGEMVRVAIDESKDQFDRAHVVDVLEASPDRIQPPCPHAGVQEDSCGGCQWQHASYEAQLRFKREIVVEQLQRIARIETPQVEEAIPCPSPFGYRRHIQVALARDGRPGFRGARSDRVVPVDGCPIAVPQIDHWLSTTSQLTGGQRFEIRSGDDEETPLQTWRSEHVANDLARTDPLTLRVKDRNFRVSVGSFFQSNALLVDSLVDLVLQSAAVASGERVLDGYCGVGLFSAFLAEDADKVVAVESSRTAVSDARVNLVDRRVELRAEMLERELPKIRGTFDVVVLDPPRSGCAKALPALIQKAPARIVYVSCDPATLARDTRVLLEAGYDLETVQPIDMFPQTFHIETVSTFRR